MYYCLKGYPGLDWIFFFFSQNTYIFLSLIKDKIGG